MGCWTYDDYRQRIKELEAEIKQITKDNIEITAVAVKKAKKDERARYSPKLAAFKKKLGGIYQRNYQHWMTGMEKNLREKVDAKISKRLDAKRLLATKHVNYIDGVLAFPVIHTYCLENNVRPFEMVFLILVCLIEKVAPRDCIKYGFPNIAYCKRKLKDLNEYGLLEVFNAGERTAYYTPSVKGMAFFKAFQTYYFKQVRLILGSDEYKRRGHKW